MGFAVHKIEASETNSSPRLTVINGGKSTSAIQSRIISKEIIILATVMVVLQVLDGVLTGIGVHSFGLHAEGNPILRSLMASMGSLPALITVKLVAVSVVISLVYLSLKVNWVPRAMRILIAIYLIAAIIPWSGILLMNLV